MSGLLYVPIAALALLARGTALAAQRRLALGPHSGAIPHSFTTDSPVTVHQLGFMFDDCNTFFKGKPDGRDAMPDRDARCGRHCDTGCGTDGPHRSPLSNFYTLRIRRPFRRLRQREHAGKFRGNAYER